MLCLKGISVKIPLVEKRPLDLFKLHKVCCQMTSMTLYNVSALIVFFSVCSKQTGEWVKVCLKLACLFTSVKFMATSLVCRCCFGRSLANVVSCMLHLKLGTFCPRSLGLTNLRPQYFQFQVPVENHFVWTCVAGSFPGVVHLSWYTCNRTPGQLSLAIPSWVGKMTTSQWALMPHSWE